MPFNPWVGVGYIDGSFFCIIFGTVFCIPFNLSQHKMTKFPALGPRKKCATPSFVTIPWYEVGVVLGTKSFQVTPLMASCYKFSVQIYVNEVNILIFESFMKIGCCLYLKIDILGQNWAWERFSRFSARWFSFAILKCTGVKINQAWPLQEIWAFYH